MAYHFEKNDQDYDLVFDGWENGISRSALSGVANMQNVNIATQNKEVMCSYLRTLQSMSSTSSSGTITPSDSTTLATTGIGSQSLKAGNWITVSGSTITGLADGTYYVNFSDGAFDSASSTLKLATTYNGDSLSGLGLTGSATFSMFRNIGKPIASAIEPYFNTIGTQCYRYYILDANGLVWVYDTSTVNLSRGLAWFLPDYSTSYFSPSSAPTGMCVLNGFLMVFSGNIIYCKPTVNLGDTTANTTCYATFTKGQMLSRQTTTNPHFAYVGHQGRAYYTDGNYIGSIFPSTSLVTGAANIQSYASYTAVTTTGTISALIGGSLPTTGASTPRIPAVFFHSLTTSAANPTAVAIGTVFYIQYALGTDTFEVYAAATGGSALDLATGAVGTQYFSTFYPTSASGDDLLVFTQQALNLPFFETATAIAEVGNLVIIGTKTNTLYPWNQVDPTPGDLIPLPENNTSYLLTVNNMVFVFAGNKGNIYITNGSTASLAISVPDYCAGLDGTASSYIEPYFIWGGPMYLRGRVYFSIQDQTSTKTGNCGGVWSFVPTQNFFYGQDTGLALRLENQNSYGTYNGAASVLIPNQEQQAKGPQYWSGWYSAISSPTYGIDVASTTTPVTTAIIETDIVPTGTLLKKRTFGQVEYKLSAPLAAGDSVTAKYRQDRSSAFTSLGAFIVESTTALSGYVPVNFEKGQWLQFEITLTSNGGTNSSFVPLKELRVR